jgi:acyl-CoA synthetase (AMP-forming)/AMP-acid ligase II
LPWLKRIVVLGDQPAPELGPNFAAWLAAQNPADPKLSLDREDVYAQLYTSGTTGNPKGVRLANRSFFAILASMRAVGDPWIGWTPDDIALHNVPTFHIAGLWWAMTALSNGAGGVIMPEFVPKEVHRLVPKFRVTKACLVPAMIQMTLAEPGVEDVDWDSLGHIVYGGSPIPKVLLKRSLEVFECGLAQIYGLTETGNTAVCLRPEDHAEDELLMAAGRPYPGVQMKIIDEAGNELGPGQIGEVCLHSPANMVEYWHLPEATAKTLIDGWIHTGDAGYTNERGYLFVCDRIKDMILCAAENIYPAEIESVLTAFPGVLEVAVIGIPDERWGESVHAILVPKPGADPIRKRALLAHCREHLADFKVPTSIEIRTENLPRTPSGKIKKTILRKPYWEGRDRQV